MPDGEGFLQRIKRRTVDDVFYAGDVLGTLDGGEVQLRDDALDFAEHGILFVDEFLQFLDVIAGQFLLFHLQHHVVEVVAQFAVSSLREFRIDELLPFLEGQLFLIFGQDAEGVLRLVFQEIYFPFLTLTGFLSFLLFSVCSMVMRSMPWV